MATKQATKPVRARAPKKSTSTTNSTATEEQILSAHPTIQSEPTAVPSNDEPSKSAAPLPTQEAADEDDDDAPEPTPEPKPFFEGRWKFLTKRHYIIRRGEDFCLGVVETIEGKYTRNPAEAVEFDGWHDAHRWADSLNKTVQEQNGGPKFELAVLLFDERGQICGAAPNDFPDEEGQPTYLDITETLHNIGLAEAGLLESEYAGEPIFFSSMYLTKNPLYRLMASEVLGDQTTYPYTMTQQERLDWFAARMFHAGVAAGRREAGRRNSKGALLLDYPGTEEASPVDQLTREENARALKHLQRAFGGAA